MKRTKTSKPGCKLSGFSGQKKGRVEEAKTPPPSPPLPPSLPPQQAPVCSYNKGIKNRAMLPFFVSRGKSNSHPINKETPTSAFRARFDGLPRRVTTENGRGSQFLLTATSVQSSGKYSTPSALRRERPQSPRNDCKPRCLLVYYCSRYPVNMPFELRRERRGGNL